MTTIPLVSRALSEGIELRLRLTPRAGSDAIDGAAVIAADAVLVGRVRAAPHDGEANAAACRLLADWFDIAASRVVLTAGHKSRIKTFRVSGDPVALSAHVDGLLGRAAER